MVSVVFDNETLYKSEDGPIRRPSHLNQTLFIFFHRPDEFMTLQIENDVPRFTGAIYGRKVSTRPPQEIRCALIRRLIRKRSICGWRFDINFFIQDDFIMAVKTVTFTIIEQG